MRNSKKIIQKGGIIVKVNETTKNNIKKIIGSEELAFCDLRQPQKRPNGVTNFNSEIPIIIVKKKNGFNQSSNYYAIKVDTYTNTLKILAEGLGKKEFYDNLIIKKSNSSNDNKIIKNSKNEDNLRKKNSKNEDENKLLSTKILIFFKLNWGNNPPFSEDFYDLNNYFVSRTY